MAELREETGLRAGRLDHVGHLFQAYGYSNQGYHLYVASDLQPGEPKPDATESDIKDATTLAAFGYLLMAIEFASQLE